VSELARRVPGASIDWMVEESFAEIAALHHAVRRIVPVAVRRWRQRSLAPSTWAEIAAFRRALRSERYDCVIDSQGLLKSALLAAQALGTRHGFDRESAREPLAALFYHRRHAVPPALHAVERNRRLAAAAMAYATQGAADYGLRAPGEAPMLLQSPFAVLLTISSRETKLWAEERWCELGSWLAGQGVASILPWGSEEERERCERLARRIEGAAVPSHMPLGELASLIARARCSIGVDTGLSHLSTALGVPTVGIYGGSDPALTGLHGGRSRNVGAAGSPPAAREVIAALGSLW